MLIFTLYMLAFCILVPQFAFSNVNPKIAIIGGGIGGTSCAYFLKQLFQDQASVSLFERDAVGGRLSLMNIDGLDYEAGGAVFHPRNQYMLEFSKLLGLALRKPEAAKFGIYNGERFIFEESDSYIWTLAKLIWTYGFSVFQSVKDVKSMLNDFARIYNLQEKGYAYSSVSLLLNAMNPAFTNMTQTTLSDILLGRGYSQNFVDTFVQSVMMVNYGQTNNISGFAGYVSLAGGEDNLWSIEGGNKLVPEGLLKLSNVEFIKSNVLEVELLSDKTFSVKYQESSSEEPAKSKSFDIVVLATPLMKGNANIHFANFKQDFRRFERTYHQTVSTFIKGGLNPIAFDTDSLPSCILTFNNTLLFNSIGKCSPVVHTKGGQDSSVYKVFSQKPLDEESIGKFFKNVDIVREKVWLAYPHYEPLEELVPFVLHPGLYYTNAIELSASAMEMSAISAKNVALLVFNSWNNAEDKIDQVLHHEGKFTFTSDISSQTDVLKNEL